MERISIIGIGAVGATLALAIRSARPSLHVRGLDEPSVLEEAERRDVIQEKAASLPAAVEGTDVVVLSTPLPTTLRLLESLAPHLAAGTLVTDTGRLMKPLCAHANEVLPDRTPFLSGHPFFFSDSGQAAAHPSLLTGRPYFLSAPEPLSDPVDEPYRAFVDLLRDVGAHPSLISAQAHDEALARSYQLPGLLAAALQQGDELPTSLPRPSLPFPLPTNRDEWRAELLANNDNLLDVTSEAGTSLQKLRNRLYEEDEEALGRLYEAAQRLSPANTSSPYRLTRTAPEAERLSHLRQMARCLEDAGCVPTDITFDETESIIVLGFQQPNEVRRAEKALRGCS